MSNSNIVDRVVERIKTQPLGDLITEEDLYDIVKEAIPKVFFAERVVPDGYNTKKLPPLVFEVLQAAMKDAVKDAVGKWVEEHKGEMLEYWKQVADKGLQAYVRDRQDAHARDLMMVVLRPLIDEHNRMASSSGGAVRPIY